ncbi:Circularly permutated YpsA SLOG family [Pelomyxa schiedti]|nr:Circularly permutated YpsA SLOG family [Pelomyxa schiedti]
MQQRRLALKVISGGQTGADRAGLEAARQLNLATGGFAPKGWLTEDGPDPGLANFGLTQANASGYPARTKMNVDASDATIAFRLHPGTGTDKTIGYCQNRKWAFPDLYHPVRRGRCWMEYTGYRPCLIITNLEYTTEIVQCIKDFLHRNSVHTINIAGHRETTAGVDNFTARVTQLLVESFQ